ncbi:MAG TPA: hypothetical protein VHS33_02485 [Sphingomicrobium sp.]|jgi:hypothetical protein|nr:hypothetical protein [Sphingomicrobium sp.]
MDSADLAEKLAATIHEGLGVDALVLVSLQPDPAAAASAISAAVNTLYKSYRDVGGMVLAAYLGVTWCLGQASLQTDAQTETALRRRAHAMSFNAAANCWPGWGDEGVTIGRAHVIAGLSLAGTCLSLSRDLELGPKAQGKAYWLVGALELALGHLGAARAAFQDAERSNVLADGEGAGALMAKAYDALAAKHEQANSDEAGSALQRGLARLRSHGSEDAQFFADQIERAERIFDARSGVCWPPEGTARTGCS